MSQMQFIAVPFVFDGSFSQIAGVAKFSPDGIALKYVDKLVEPKGVFSAVVKNVVKKSSSEIDEILDVKFKKGIFKIGARIEIRLKIFDKLGEIPNRNGKIILKINRADFECAEKAVADLLHIMRNDFHVALPNAQSPVSRLFDEDETRREEDV